MDKLSKRFFALLMPAGMLGGLLYFAMNLSGAMLWPEYDSARSLIGALHAAQAPQELLMSILYGLSTCLIALFSLAWLAKWIKEGGRLMRLGAAALVLAAAMICFGEPLLTGEWAGLLLTLLAAAGCFALAAGLPKEMKQPRLGRLIGLFGWMNVLYLMIVLVGICMGNTFTGLHQRVIYYTFVLLEMMLSYLYTFREKYLK